MNDVHLLFWLLLCGALAVPLAWRLPPRWQAPAMALCGALFLAVLSPVSLGLLAIASVATWSLRNQLHRRGVLPAAVAAVVLLYGVHLWQGTSEGDGIAQRLVLPLGMAFYSLRLVHYLFEAQRQALRAHGLAEYLAYQLLPGPLPLGPIHRFDEFLRDWRRRRWDSEAFAAGLGRVAWGLAKVVFVAGHLLGYRWPGLAGPWLAEPGLLNTYTADLGFWLSLYVVFSGYSDMAIGFSALLGLRLRENFDRPYLAGNITDFWQRWHMSLSGWCRDYVYTPVLALWRWHGLALVSSMLVLGLWHALSLHYLLWGFYHGAGLVVHRHFRRLTRDLRQSLAGWRATAWRLVAVVLTLHFVVFSFRATQFVEDWIRSL
ncbi:MAG: MBOAT family O-acyltransferase [Pseudomonadota bacterium]